MEKDIGESYSAISFAGGGQKFTYTSADIANYQSVNGTSKNLEVGIGGELSINTKVFGPLLGFELGLMVSYVEAGRDETTTSSEKTAERSFTLSDPDLGDYFDVEVTSICI